MKLTWEQVENTTQAVVNSERGWEATTSTHLAPKIVKACNRYEQLEELAKAVIDNEGQRAYETLALAVLGEEYG